MEKILITGGNGFVGSHLIERLSQDYETSVFDINHGTNHYIEGDVTNPSDFRKIPPNLEGIIHLAGKSRLIDGYEDPLDCMRLNIMGTINVFEYAKENGLWVINAGTHAPLSHIHGVSKKATESAGKVYFDSYGTKIMTLKFSTVYGQDDNPNKVIPRLIQQALNNRDITINNGDESYDFIHIDDLVEGIFKGVRKISNIDTYHAISLCTGMSVNLEQLTKLIINETNSSSKFIVKKRQEEKYLLPNPKKAEDILNFKSKIDFETGIREIIKKFK